MNSTVFECDQSQRMIRKLPIEKKFLLGSDEDPKLWMELQEKQVIEVNWEEREYMYSKGVYSKISEWMERNEIALIELLNFPNIFPAPSTHERLGMIIELFKRMRVMILEAITLIIGEQGVSAEALTALTNCNEAHADKVMLEIIRRYLKVKREMRWNRWS